METCIYINPDEEKLYKYISRPENWIYSDNDDVKYGIHNDDVYIIIFPDKSRQFYYSFARKIRAEISYFKENDCVIFTYQTERFCAGTYASHVYSLLTKKEPDKIYLEKKRLKDAVNDKDSWLKVGDRTYIIHLRNPIFREEEIYEDITSPFQGLRFLSLNNNYKYAEFEYYNET